MSQQLQIWAQSRTSNHKAWDRYPSSEGGKMVGIIPKVFVHEVFGNVTQTLLVSFPKYLVRIFPTCLFLFWFKVQQKQVGKWGEILTEDFRNDTQRVWECCPKNSGDVPKDFMNEDLAHRGFSLKNSVIINSYFPNFSKH